VDPPTSAETINGSERIGWDQIAADSTDLATIRYAIYVDNIRAELANVSCAPTTAGGPFACAARLPALTPGSHTLELASFIVDGSLLESAKSAPLRVVVSAATAQAVVAPGRSSRSIESVAATIDGARFRLEVVAEQVEHPVDIAFAPDGRVLVAERGGRVRILDGGRSSGRIPAAERIADEGELLALAIDPQFERNHFVYAVTRVLSRGRPTFSLARFREASNTFGDRVPLLDGLPARSADPSAALRFGPDGTLFVAFDDGDEPAAAADLGSTRGKILRLNADGTTPADQAGLNPVFALGFRSPRAMVWRPGSDIVWVAERDGTLVMVEAERTRTDRKTRGVTQSAYALPAPTAPSSIAPFRDGLLVASDNGPSLLRVRFDQQRPTVIVGTEVVLRDQFGPIRIVGVGIDGVIYVGTADTIARLMPQIAQR